MSERAWLRPAVCARPAANRIRPAASPAAAGTSPRVHPDLAGRRGPLRYSAKVHAFLGHLLVAMCHAGQNPPQYPECLRDLFTLKRSVSRCIPQWAAILETEHDSCVSSLRTKLGHLF